MKKLFAVFVMAIFVLSIFPIAIAEDEGNKIVNKTRTGQNLGISPVAHDFEDCIKTLKAQYPNSSQEKIAARCKEISGFANRTKIAEKALQRAYLSEKVQSATPEARLRVLDRLSQDNPKAKEFVMGLSDDDVQKFLALDREQQKKVLSEGKEALKDYRLKKVEVKQEFKQREVAKEKLERAEKNFLEAEKRYINAKQDYALAREKFENAVKAGNEEEARLYAKEFLLSAADMVIESLEKVKEKAESSDDLTEEEVAEIVAEIDAKIKEMEDAKAAVESATTKEEIKAAGAKIIAAWNEARIKLKIHTAKVVEAKVGEIIQRSESLERKLERVLADMEERNITVDDIDEKVDDFSAKIDDARELFDDGKELFLKAKEIRTSGNATEEQREQAQEYAEQAKEKIRQAHQNLKEAHQILMEIAKMIKAEGGSLDVKTDEDEYDVEEVEEDEAEEEEEIETEDDDSDDANQTDDSDDENEDISDDNESNETEDDSDSEDNQSDDTNSTS